MTETMVVEPAIGAAVLSASAWRALLDLAGPGAPDAENPDRDGNDGARALEAEGLLSDGELFPPVARALDAVRAPSCRLRVSSRGLEAQGWLDADIAALLIPRGAGLFELAWLPAAFLPDALARLVALEPRPVPQGLPLRLAPGTLAHLLAAPYDWVPLPGTDLDGGSRQDRRARELAAAVRRHWRIEARTIAEAGPDHARSVEALDTPEGLWRLLVDGAGVELRPTSPTRLWRELTRLVSAPDRPEEVSESV